MLAKGYGTWMFQAEVRPKTKLQRDPSTVHWSARQRAAEFGHEQVGLVASSVGGRDTGPSIFLLPGIISHLFSLQLFFSQETREALKRRDSHTVLTPCGSAMMGRWECSRLLLSLCDVGWETRQKAGGGLGSSQELQNNQALFSGFEKTHTLGNPAG